MRLKKIAMALVAGMLALPSTSQAEDDQLAKWKEDYAYSLGVQAYIFGFPWKYQSELLHEWVAVTPKNPDLTPNMPLNNWWHARNIITSDYRDGGAPNNDTLYSITWLDLGKEPIILTHGDMGDRYFTFEMASFNSDNFAYVGKRTTGSKAGSWAITGPDWNGTLPEGVNKLPPSPTDFALIFGRTAVSGQDDVKGANAAQDTYKLTPLSQWGEENPVVAKSRDVPAPFNAESDPLAVWKTINRAMVRNPPLDQHQVLMGMFKNIGIGPGIDVGAMDEATQKGLARAAADGQEMMLSMLATGLGAPKVNGWSFPPNTMGRAMIENDFNTLSIQSLGGIIANDPKEAVYINTHSDAGGETLSGDNKYVLRFEAGQLPEVEYFWSLTMYDLTNNLVKNPIDRWAIGSLGGGYSMAEDGSLTLYVQQDSPGEDKESNWLPAPDGEFWLVFRTYGPSDDIVEQVWQMPPLEKVN